MNAAHDELGLFELFTRVLQRELAIAMRKPGQWLIPLVFFIIVLSLFPLGIGPAPNQLRAVAPGLVWVTALLAMLLSLDALFAADFRDGSLEQLVLSPQPLSLIVLARVAAHWLLSGLPLLLLSPLMGLVLNLPDEALPTLLLGLLIGTWILGLIGAIGAALTLGVNQSGVLLSLLVLPLSVPVLIFGSAAVTAAVEGMAPTGPLAMLSAILAGTLALAPWATAAALRVGVGASG